jgi:phospholipase/carboxylesterase
MKLDTISILRDQAEFHIILCHGFGASKHDLAGLAEWLDPRGRFSWHFPQAPYPLKEIGGWAWFPREAPAMAHVMAGDYFDHLETVSDPGLDASARELAELAAGLGIPGSRLVIGGFSQGSMVALQAVLSAGLRPAALLVLSGNLVDRAGTERSLPATLPCPVFQSHGMYDQVLPLAGARTLRSLLETRGFPVEWCGFPGGHEINETVVSSLAAFLDRLAQTLS